MENETHTQIENNVKALFDELKPIFKEIAELTKSSNSLVIKNDEKPLKQLISHLTKTARRHDLDTQIELKGQDLTIGTNHNGLGYVAKWSSQLTSICEQSGGYYSSLKENEQHTRDILFNDEVVIDLVSTIKKSNQKMFLKLVKILKKYNLINGYEAFKDENIDFIKIPLSDENKYSIGIFLDRCYRTKFKLIDDEGDGERELEINNDENGNPEVKINKEDISPLNQISKFQASNFTLSEIKLAYFISQHKDLLLTAIKSKRELLNSVSEAYKNEHKELNELLEPILALEKL